MSNLVSAAEHARLRAENQALHGQLEALRRELAWFKRQLFGEKSERHRVLDPAVQASLFEASAVAAPAEPERESITYTRRKGKNRDNAATDTGPRFDDSVPRRVIEVPPPAACHDHEIVATRSTFRLAQRRAGYEILEYRHPLLKALGYVHERKAALEVFLEHADVPIDTNHLERGLRPIPMGRRN